MKLVPRLLVATLAIGLAALSTPARADLYDTPTASILQVTRTSVKVQVRAGATGAPAGFAVDWMYKSDYDAAGGWDNGWSYGTLYWCTFTGTPTWNYAEGVGSYSLAPYEAQVVEVGDVFDETGMEADYLLELQPGRQVVIRAYALGDANGETSYYTSTILTETLPQTNNCTYTQGFWKTHPSAWPVLSVTLGTVNYNQTQLLSIFNKPAAGNGLLILAHQLIAAKLNIAQGADPTPVSAAIAAADALIGGLVVPPVGSGFLAPSAVNALASTLDNYNNGFTSVPHCGSTEGKVSSWGAIKSLYR